MADSHKYQFNFAWKSPYGHVIKLIEQVGIKPGVVLDLGCGYGPVAEPLAERGFKYIGFDLDEDALENLSARGFDSRRLNLADGAALEETLSQYATGHSVSAVLLLDVLEHLPSTRTFLTSLRNGLNSIGQPLLITALPNVGHVDVGAKLAFGRFDYTATGLLDETHLSFFTEERMSKEFKALGWVHVGKNDFLLAESDQHFPASHPALTVEAPLGGLVANLRNQVDDCSHVNQFVRAFALTNAALEASPKAAPSRFLTVLVRTQGLRPASLREALTCLAAQSSKDFEVKILVHTESDRLRAAVQAIVDEFHPTFAERVDVTQVTGGGQRGRPLNAGLDLANSEYIAFLDDDDMVTGDWVEAFETAARQTPGKIVRSVTVDQEVERASSTDIRAPYIVRAGLDAHFAPDFDLTWHFHNNQTPICSFALPKALIDAFKLKFDETLPVTEDWEFLLRASQVTGVTDTGRITSLYHRWTCGEGSSGVVESTVWDGIRTSILHRLDQFPLLLPINSATKLAELSASVSQIPDLFGEIARLTAQVEEARSEARSAREEAHAARERTAQAVQAADASRAIADAFERSRVWRSTAPLRWILARFRLLLRRSR